MSATLLKRVNTHASSAFLVLICLLSSSIIIVASQRGIATIGSRGSIRVDDVGVYSDSDCSTAMQYLDWGTLEPGSALNATVYIRNEGTHAATILLATENWSPIEASNYMGLNWNYDGRTLNIMEVVEITLTLSISSNIQNIASFSFDILMVVS